MRRLQDLHVAELQARHQESVKSLHVDVSSLQNKMAVRDRADGCLASDGGRRSVAESQIGGDAKERLWREHAEHVVELHENEAVGLAAGRGGGGGSSP